MFQLQQIAINRMSIILKNSGTKILGICE